MNSNKAASIGIWVLSAITGALFLLSGAPKFVMAGWVSRFAGWGYPEWFLYVIAALEVLGGIGLLIPKLSPYAAGGLIVIMVGAMYTHLTHDQGIWWNLGYVVSLAIIGAYRWRHRN